jgi:ABC-type multidrug transport system ATPase subunit
MGPSGAGKTTLLNVLLGKIQKSNGSIFINGKQDDIRKYVKSIGFVPQVSIFPS